MIKFLKTSFLLSCLLFGYNSYAQAENFNAGMSSVAEEQKKAKERAKAKEAAEKAAAEAKHKEEASKNPQNLKVVKMQPKVQERARTLDDIANYLGISRERVRQIRDKAIRRLRRRNRNFQPSLSN